MTYHVSKRVYQYVVNGDQKDVNGPLLVFTPYHSNPANRMVKTSIFKTISLTRPIIFTRLKLWIAVKITHIVFNLEQRFEIIDDQTLIRSQITIIKTMTIMFKHSFISFKITII